MLSVSLPILTELLDTECWCGDVINYPSSLNVERRFVGAEAV
jgi:hypothetical protein